MSTEITDQIHDGVPEGHPPDEAVIFARARQLRRRRRALTGAAVGLIGVLVVAVPVLASFDVPDVVLDRSPADRDGQSAVLEVPALDEVNAVWLGDGTPVFVVHHHDGQVSVVEAVTHRPSSWDKMVGWCRSSRTFDDVQHGAKWDEHGRYISGPARTGLATFATSVEAEGVGVGERQSPEGPAAEADRPQQQAGPSCWPGRQPPPPGFVDEQRIAHAPEDAPVPMRPPEQLGDAGRVVVHGTVAARHGHGTQICSVVDGDPPACPAGSPHVDDVQTPATADWLTLTGTFVATAADGKLEDLVTFIDVQIDAQERHAAPDANDAAGRVPVSAATGSHRQR